MKTKIKSIVYELLLIDKDIIDYTENKDDYFLLLEEEREARVNELIRILSEGGE